MESVDLHRREPRRWLWMCAQSASTSYHEILAQEVLLQALATGAIPVNFIPHMCHILEEASIQSVVMAVEQAAQRSGMLPAQMRSQTKCERKRATFEFTGNTRLYTQGPVE
nr:hypothetical protein [uncultured Albidiferax sp.]